MISTNVSARDKAIALLARREHSCHELRNKLAARGFSASEADEAIARLRHDGLQSDERFAEAYCRMRRLRGYGPCRVKQELRERGMHADLIDMTVDERDSVWQEGAHTVWEKKFGGQSENNDFKARMKQASFLQYRGFTQAQIQTVLRE